MRANWQDKQKSYYTVCVAQRQLQLNIQSTADNQSNFEAPLISAIPVKIFTNNAD